MLATFKAFTVLLILSGTPSKPPAILRTLNDADTFEQCSKKAQEIEGDSLWKRPIKAICYSTSLLMH